MTPKTHLTGTHRVVAPRETVARMTPFLAELGITRVANVTGMDCVGIPTVMVVRPNSRSLSVSQGKGVDLEAAKASGIMEAVEQALAEAIDAPLRLATLRELERKARVADVARLPRYVRPFDRDVRIPWICARALADEEPIWVPYELVHLDLRLPLPEGSGHFLAGSNGLASGNHRLEAVSHGLCEVIERDAMTLFQLRPPEAQDGLRIDPRTIDDPECRRILERLARAGIATALWDVSSDVGVPCVLCAIIEATTDTFRPVGLARGAGCHPDRAVAVSRALTEAAQSRLTRIVGSRDDFRRGDVAALRTDGSISHHRARIAGAGSYGRRFADLPTFAGATLEDDVSWLRSRMAASLGEDGALVVDLSRPEYPVSVARVIVPGLEGLSEVPGYEMGPRARAAAERAVLH